MFIGEQIEVQMVGEPVKVPVSFRWYGSDYHIAEVLASWADFGYGQTPPRRPHWWQRRHRNYYRVKTDTGETFEIYYDRGTRASHPERRKWYLFRRI